MESMPRIQPGNDAERSPCYWQERHIVFILLVSCTSVQRFVASDRSKAPWVGDCEGVSR